MNNEKISQEIKLLLRRAIAPVKNTELERDLWPQMLGRLNAQPLRVSWFDWALAAILSAILVFSPGAIPALLYHL